MRHRWGNITGRKLQALGQTPPTLAVRVQRAGRVGTALTPRQLRRRCSPTIDKKRAIRGCCRSSTWEGAMLKCGKWLVLVLGVVTITMLASGSYAQQSRNASLI